MFAGGNDPGQGTEVESAIAEPKIGVGRRGRKIPAGIVAVAVVLTAALAFWWFQGGEFLSVSGNTYGVAVSEGTEASLGLGLSSDGGSSVVLDHVSATVTPEAEVTWSIYRVGPGEIGFGISTGPLHPQWQTIPVDGTHVSISAAHPELGATFLIATIHTSEPGVHKLTDVAVTYQSGWRTRTSKSSVVFCILVYPAKTSYEALQQTNDPLLEEYDNCLN